MRACAQTWERGGAGPYAQLNHVLTSFPGSLNAGPDGVILGRFGWALAGVLTNLYSPGAQLGFVLPTYRMRDWQRVYWACDPTACDAQRFPVLRSGNGVVLATQGNFWTPFEQGAQAGDPVFANPANGAASSYDPGASCDPAGGYIQTAWIVTRGCGCGEFARISSYAKGIFNG